MMSIRVYLILAVSAAVSAVAALSQPLPPKQAYPLMVRQLHSGHSLTDPLFHPHWPGQYVNLMGVVTTQAPWQLWDRTIGKSTVPGSSMTFRWQNPPGYGAADPRRDIANWEVLSITERVPLYYEGGNAGDWYQRGIAEQRTAFTQFVNNTWTQGNGGKGAATLLWSTWVHVDGSSGDFRSMLDVQGGEWERMQDYANERRPAGATPVYIIPGHRMMARLYDDIEKKLVPGITSITQFFSDAIHTNELGAYAIALIHYACIFNRNPRGLPNNLLPGAPADTPIPSPELAAYLQDMVWDVVTTYPRTGVLATTSVTERTVHSDHSSITLSPNPVHDHLTVTLHETASDHRSLRIHDVTGAIMMHVAIIPGATTAEIATHQLPGGVYYITTQGPTGTTGASTPIVVVR